MPRTKYQGQKWFFFWPQPRSRPHQDMEYCSPSLGFHLLKKQDSCLTWKKLLTISEPKFVHEMRVLVLISGFLNDFFK